MKKIRHTCRKCGYYEDRDGMFIMVCPNKCKINGCIAQLAHAYVEVKKPKPPRVLSAPSFSFAKRRGLLVDVYV
jgi:hypothetical protein